MKLVLFSGTHPRHLFVNREVAKLFDDVLIFVMQREALITSPPIGVSKHDENLFNLHFNRRNEVESRIYGQLDWKSEFKGKKVRFLDPTGLNSIDTVKILKEFGADIAFIFGVNIIKNPVLECLPKDKVNLHLGLSPWYKGGATLYWPFYHLQPQFAGVTFHQITERPDAGEIIHQSVPILSSRDGIHDVGAKCVINAAADAVKLISKWHIDRSFKGEVQKTTGRVWRSCDFHPSQLRVIYDLFDDSIVDAYLQGELDQTLPRIISAF